MIKRSRELYIIWFSCCCSKTWQKEFRERRVCIDSQSVGGEGMAGRVALGMVAGVWGSCHIVFTVLKRDGATIHQLPAHFPCFLIWTHSPRIQWNLLGDMPCRCALETPPGDMPWRPALKTPLVDLPQRLPLETCPGDIQRCVSQVILKSNPVDNEDWPHRVEATRVHQ